MEFSLLINVLRQRPISIVCAGLLLAVTASLGGADAPTIVGLWIVAAALLLGVWYRAERFALGLSGCRPLSAREHETLKTALEGLGESPWILDRAEAWVVRGLRTTVVGSDLIDLLDDRALRAILYQASRIDRSAVAGDLVVWLGLLPLKAAWLVNGWIGQLGRLLALVVGTTLVVPMVIWREGYVRWAGRLFAAMLGGMLSTLVLTSGMTLLAVLLMTSWAIVPAMRALLAWEWRRAERRADEAVAQMGLGWELLGAFDDLVWLDPPPVPPGLMALFHRVGLPVRERLDRMWQAMSEAAEH